MISTIDQTDKLLARVKHLPPAPKVLLPLLAALTDPDSDMERVVDMISVDPALTARLLQMCNTPVFNTGLPVTSAHEAVSRLGFQTVYRVVALARVETLLRPSKMTGMDPGRLWEHGAGVGFAAQFIAQEAKLPSSLCFTAGILHDIGKLILAEAFQPDYSLLCKGGVISGTMLIEREETRFGSNHAEVGARLLENWDFEEAMTAAVRYHHAPQEAGAHTRLAACVNLADSLAHRLGSGQETQSDPELHGALELLGLKLSDVSYYMEELQEQVSFVQALCSLRS